MDSPVNNQEEKKLADIRKELTPDGDDSCDEVGSEEQSNLYQDRSVKKFNSQEDQELWEDTSVLEKGQSQSLRPIDGDGKFLDSKVLREIDVGQSQSVKVINGQEKILESEIDIPVQKIKQPEKQKPTEKKQQKYKKKKRSYQQKQPKIYRVNYDSKFIFAAYELLHEELKKQITPQMGYLRFNPYINTKQIIIYYYDDQKKDLIAEIVDNNIDDLQVMQMSKIEAQSGIQLSFKYRQQLLRQKISFFIDKTQNFKNISYYICGYKVNKSFLYQKIAEIKKISFIWMHLFRFQNTRSYRAILRKMFDTPQMHSFIRQKFKAKQIQVAYAKKDFPLPPNTDKRGILIILTVQGQKKITIHQQIQQLLSAFIRQNFLVFCFTFIRKKQYYKYQYTPKVDKVIWFFIEEKNLRKPTSYLYIIVNRKDFQEVKQTIIKQIEAMKLDIIARRFFKNFYPQLKEKDGKSDQRIYGYPKVRPYSWSLTTPKGVQFNWVSQLTL